MFVFLRRYWKYIFFVFSVILVFTVGYIYYRDNSIDTTSEKKLSVTLEEKKEEDNNEDLKTVFVDVKGAVNTPGVYEIDSDKRIIDAINLAGGLSNEADTINLNLSKRVTDEMYIIVYTKTEIYNYKKDNGNKEISCASVECVCPNSNNNGCITNNTNSTTSDIKEEKNDSNLKISINSASKEELMKLSGIGESKADAIISYRNENGKFTSIDEIKNVSGIGDSIFEKIKDNIVL